MQNIIFDYGSSPLASAYQSSGQYKDCHLAFRQILYPFILYMGFGFENQGFCIGRLAIAKEIWILYFIRLASLSAQKVFSLFWKRDFLSSDSRRIQKIPKGFRKEEIPIFIGMEINK